MELNQFPLNNYITQTSDSDITWLLPGISLVGTQDKSSLGPQGKALRYYSGRYIAVNLK